MATQAPVSVPPLNVTLNAYVHDGADPLSPDTIVDLTTGSPVVEVDYKANWGFLTPLLAGKNHDVTVYWEGMGTAPEGEHTASVSTNLVAGNAEIIQTIDLAAQMATPGVYRMTAVVQYNDAGIRWITGFVDLGMIQLFNS